MRFVQSGRMVVLSVCVLGAGGAWGYQYSGSRWSRTATDGFGLGQGDPTTLTWSIVPDGTDTYETENSDLIAFFDGLYGDNGGGSDLTTRPWFFIFNDSFERYEALSGLTLTYVSSDDGQPMSGSTNGFLGVRGDVRIGGASIDGQSGSNTLAYNYFPNHGDMLIDTDNTSFYNGRSNNSRGARNVIMHEFGHGLGISHVESNNASFLMEPFISTAFDGPQLDDILALHRGYGDAYEKSNNGNGNEVSGNATSLGFLTLGAMTSIGTDADNTFVAANDIDFVSIDDNNDTDYFSFTLTSGAYLDLTLTPKGPTYNEGPQNGTQSAFNSAALSDLTLALFDTNGSSLLESSDSTGLGGSESIMDFLITSPGTYFARIKGKDNAAQFYQLDLFATALPVIPGDLNGDLKVNDEDLALIFGHWGLTVTAGALLNGDANGDGYVDWQDQNLVLRNWTGDEFAAFDVPEPGALFLFLGAIAVGAVRPRRNCALQACGCA